MRTLKIKITDSNKWLSLKIYHWATILIFYYLSDLCMMNCNYVYREKGFSLLKMTVPSISIHLYNWMKLHQSNHQSISELFSSQSVDKARQWLDSGLIKLLVWSIEKTRPFAFLSSNVWPSNLSSQESSTYFNVSKLNPVHKDW